MHIKHPSLDILNTEAKSHIKQKYLAKGVFFLILKLSPPGPDDAHSDSVWAVGEQSLHPGAAVTGHRHEGDNVRILIVHS